MDFNSCYEKLQNLANEIGITVTDDTKPTELFDAVIKLLAAYIIGQPDSDEIAENALDKLRRNVEILRISKGR